ncbi:sensor histidine kinase [Qaidamihabitans albus]|uniref:sensor histidine kinase n=1 Tax=Qaidamihabitans albus TaxID=2795733 RepID=UPI0027DE4416|nr:sensor histidine kinase [Qaidamihabitans albus]
MKLLLPHRHDLLLAGVLGVVGVVGTVATDSIVGVDRRVDTLAIALVVAGVVAVAFRRRWPLATLALVTVLTATYLALGYPYGPVFFPFVVAVYTVASRRPLTTSVPPAFAALVALLVHLFTHEAAIDGFAGLGPATAWVAVPFSIGITVRLTRDARQREQAEAVRERVYDERLRIAQEVHDVVGHGLAAIKMQAEVALHLLAKKPEQAEHALTEISRTSTEALDEVRATLAVVRQQQDAARTPIPGLVRINDLTQRMTEAGLQVDVDTTGTPRDLPPAVELAGYRIVQESLTNVLRHGARKIATVRVGYDTGAVLIEVSNPSPGRLGNIERTGFGITGMTERVTALGGEFSAGPTGDGRFQVRASIPIGDST